MALDRESREVAILIVDGHLPESRSEVDGGENVGVGPADVADAFVDLFHGVFVRVGLFIETSEVLNDAQASSPFLWNTEDGGVVGGFGFANYSEPEPFFQRLLHEGLVIRFERELFVVHWLVVLEIESVLVGLAPTQVRF